MKMFELKAADYDGNIELMHGTRTIRLYADDIDDAYDKLVDDYDILQDDIGDDELCEVHKIVGYERYSMETQPRIPQFIGWNTDEVFTDIGTHSSNGNIIGTDEFSRMLDILNEGDMVLVTSLCRLSRVQKVMNERMSEIHSRDCVLYVTSTREEITPPQWDA